ncbi:MAG: PAS domain S-box protein [Desulfobacteraceae bacterium]|nr:PAS domain S-box protein [Desulfobacteraceae bacterium]
MKPISSDSRSMARQFNRDYLIVSIIPLTILFILVVLGATITRNYLAKMIVQATAELNQDAELNLQKLGERIIQAKARDVAKQLEVYFRAHPNMDIKEMRNDPQFMELAIQKVGETGYTAVTEADTYLFRVHPNSKLNDRDMHFLAERMPSWWKIVQAAISGKEASGYYDWIEPDGTIRKKYLTTTPVKVPLNGITMMASATTYIDEFSAPVVEMKARAATIVEEYKKFIARQWLLFNAISIGLILLTFVGTYFLGRRAALRYIRPMEQLAQAARQIGEGQWNVKADESVIQRKDEIGTLAQAFNRMSSQLLELFSRLEQRVAELNKTQSALKESETHFKELYEESKRAEQLYRSLIHSSADAIVIYDLSGQVRYLSPMFTKIFGWNEEELIGQAIPFIPESELAATQATFADIIGNGTLCHGFESKRSTKDCRLIDVSISASRYDDHEGHPAGMLVILRDITEKKRLEAKFKHIERMEAIGTLAGGIAHDFNNLLMVIQGSTTMLGREIASSHAGYKYLSNIEKQVQRGAKLTSQLLGYARKGKYYVRSISLNSVVMESSEAFSRTRKDITIHYDLAADLLPIKADIYQIEQVLMNIYINASDAMPDGGRLYLRTENVHPEQLTYDDIPPNQGPMVRLSIQDTGTGMSPTVMEKIFDPFFTTKEMGRGTGLGLASVYGIIKAHNGYIYVDSTEGQGSTFTFLLPATMEPIKELPQAPKLAPVGKGTVLLIDDEALVREIAAEMIKTLGYTVLIADSGHMAIEIYKDQADKIDLVILDMIMPDMSGSVAFDQLKAINPNAAILLSSGYSIDGKATEILNRGCKGFIQKPFSMELLAQRIRQSIFIE